MRYLTYKNIGKSIATKWYYYHIRNGRLRHYLAQRYDSRKGVFDWDYHMKLQDIVSQ